VILEVAIQVAAQVIGNDAVVTLGGGWGVLELNVMLPVIGRATCSNRSRSFPHRRRCLLQGVLPDRPNRARCAELIEQSLAMVTPLAGPDRI